jgi:hypothetical protein
MIITIVVIVCVGAGITAYVMITRKKGDIVDIDIQGELVPGNTVTLQAVMKNPEEVKWSFAKDGVQFEMFAESAQPVHYLIPIILSNHCIFRAQMKGDVIDSQPFALRPTVSITGPGLQGSSQFFISNSTEFVFYIHLPGYMVVKDDFLLYVHTNNDWTFLQKVHFQGVDTKLTVPYNSLWDQSVKFRFTTTTWGGKGYGPELQVTTPTLTGIIPSSQQATGSFDLLTIQDQYGQALQRLQPGKPVRLNWVDVSLNRINSTVVQVLWDLTGSFQAVDSSQPYTKGTDGRCELVLPRVDLKYASTAVSLRVLYLANSCTTTALPLALDVGQLTYEVPPETFTVWNKWYFGVYMHFEGLTEEYFRDDDWTFKISDTTLTVVQILYSNQRNRVLFQVFCSNSPTVGYNATPFKLYVSFRNQSIQSQQNTIHLVRTTTGLVTGPAFTDIAYIAPGDSVLGNATTPGTLKEGQKVTFRHDGSTVGVDLNLLQVVWEYLVNDKLKWTTTTVATTRWVTFTLPHVALAWETYQATLRVYRQLSPEISLSRQISVHPMVYLDAVGPLDQNTFHVLSLTNADGQQSSVQLTGIWLLEYEQNGWHKLDSDAYKVYPSQVYLSTYLTGQFQLRLVQDQSFIYSQRTYDFTEFYYLVGDTIPTPLDGEYQYTIENVPQIFQDTGPLYTTRDGLYEIRQQDTVRPEVKVVYGLWDAHEKQVLKRDNDYQYVFTVTSEHIHNTWTAPFSKGTFGISRDHQNLARSINGNRVTLKWSSTQSYADVVITYQTNDMHFAATCQAQF